MDLVYYFFQKLVHLGLLPMAFEQAFTVRAFIAACIIGPLLGSFGTIVVAKQMVFFSQTLGNAALTGVAIGLLIGEPLNQTYLGLYGFTLIVAFLMNYINRHMILDNEVIVGLILSQVLGLGIVLLIIVTKKFDVHQVEAILFGNLITVSEFDVVLLFIISILCSVYLYRNFNRLLLSSLGIGIEQTKQSNTFIESYFFTFVLTLLVVSSLKLIGALLVLALLVSPAATAKNISNNLLQYFWLSFIFGGIIALSGVIVSAIWPIPTGGAIVFSAGVLFLLSFIKRSTAR